MYTPQIGWKRRQIFTSPSLQGNVSGLCWSFPLLWERTPVSPNEAQKLLIFKKDWAFGERRGHISACLHDCSTKRNCCKGRLQNTREKSGCRNTEAVDLTSNIPIERLFGPGCIPDDTWGVNDPREGFCMQLTSPASCKKYLKSQWGGRQSTPVDF